MHFTTYADLNRDILNNISKIPSEIDLVVGVPRSGMIVANIISLYLNKPLTDLESYFNGRIMSVGNTKNLNSIVTEFLHVKNVLIVEDSVSSGKSIINVKERVKKTNYKHNITYLAAYVFSNMKSEVDIYFRTIDGDRLFEWNYLHNSLLEFACFDIDGVLCEDPSDEQNDDGSKYLAFINNAKLKLFPTRTIGHIVTSRLEKYRPQTEEWLNRNNIHYKKLHMMELSSAEERRKLNNHAQFKASIYKNLKDCSWFVESNPNQAEEIAQLTGKLVYCTGNQTCYTENTKNQVKHYVSQSLPKKIKGVIKRIVPSPLIMMYKKARKK